LLKYFYILAIGPKIYCRILTFKQFKNSQFWFFNLKKSIVDVDGTFLKNGGNSSQKTIELHH